MEVESAESGDDIGAIKEKQQENGTSGDQVNGLKNGYASDKHKSHHKSEHKDKHRDKDKHRSKEHKSSSKDKHSSSSSKDKERHSSSHKSSSKDKERDRHREKEKDRHRDDKDRDKDKKSSSSTKDKDRENKHRDKDKDREHKSGSSSKDKDRDRERHKDREGHDKDKHRSRDKDKDRHSSSSKDKHRDKDKHHSSSRDKERKEKRERESDELKSKQEENDSREVEVKQEITENINVSAASSCDYSMSQFKDEPKEEIEEEEEEDEQPSQEEEEEEEEEQPSQEEEDEEELKPKVEVDSDEDVPLSARSSSKKRKKVESDDDYQNEDEDEDVPLSARKKPKKEKKKRKHAMSDDDEEDYEDVKPIKKEKKKKRAVSDEEEYDDFKPIKKEKKQKKAKAMTDEVKTERGSPKKGGRKKKEEEEQEVWKWWEEEKKEDGTKWNFLEHKGPVFAPPYERLPESVKFYYDGKEMHLSSVTEEVAGFYAKMLDHDYTTKDVFNNNFFKDWRKCMSSKEQATITDLKKCNFKPMHAYFMDIAEKNRNRTKEEKLALKEKNEEIIKEYGFCKIDGHKEKIGNFKIEPPGLFRGRGEHPKMGMLKKRVEAEHIIINCSKNSVIPKAPEGHKWKEVRHDPSVTWLASWTENVQNQVKYIMLNPSSKLKGEKDMAKYETARRLHKCIDKIRREYKDDWKSKEMRVRQRAVALYFIDRLALRAGNEKDEDQADTVGCCSLRVEHIELHEKKDDKEYVVCFDFLGKDSIRYYNEVPVEKRVFKNLQLFIENKSPGDDLFDRLNTSILNKHLNELMEGLTAKVFRTYNASITLQEQLGLLTNEDDSVSEKMLSYNRANRAVAILCNHQRSVPKSHDKSMSKLKEKIETKKDAIKDAERQVKDAQRDAKHGSVKEKTVYDKKKKLLQRLREQLVKLEVQETDRDENKTIALGTSKLNYLDPRISVAWCKKYEVPIEKVYNKTQRDKFRWAIDMAGPDYVF